MRIFISYKIILSGSCLTVIYSDSYSDELFLRDCNDVPDINRLEHSLAIFFDPKSDAIFLIKFWNSRWNITNFHNSKILDFRPEAWDIFCWNVPFYTKISQIHFSLIKCVFFDEGTDKSIDKINPSPFLRPVQPHLTLYSSYQ